MGRNKHAELTEETAQTIRFMNKTSLITLAISLVVYPASLTYVNVTSPELIRSGGWFFRTDPISDVCWLLTFIGVALSVVLKGVAAEIRYRVNHVSNPDADSEFFVITTVLRIALWAGIVFASLLFSQIFTFIMNDTLR